MPQHKMGIDILFMQMYMYEELRQPFLLRLFAHFLTFAHTWSCLDHHTRTSIYLQCMHYYGICEVLDIFH